MDWTIRDVPDANHNPEVTVNGQPGKAPLFLKAVVGTPLTLDAAGTRDPDGHELTYIWFVYPEAGTGIPGQPVVAAGLVAIGGGGVAGEGGIPSAESGPREPPPRITIENADTPRATVMPHMAGTAHVLLAVEDNGTPSLTSYRRIILTIASAASGQ
jgi:hypothetical protein